jgi:hypothetical protein
MRFRCGNPDVVEVQLAGVLPVQPDLLELAPTGEAGHVAFHDKKAESAGTGLGVRPDGDDHEVGAGRAADEGLLPGEDPVRVRSVAVAVGAGPDALQITARPGFGHRQRAEQLAPGEWDQPALLLLLGGEVEEVGEDEVVLQAQGHTERGRADAGDLLVDDHPVPVVGLACAAVLLGDGERVHALSGRGGEHGPVDDQVLLPLQEMWGHLAGEKLAHGCPVLLVIVGVERSPHGSRCPFGRWTPTRRVFNRR